MSRCGLACAFVCALTASRRTGTGYVDNATLRSIFENLGYGEITDDDLAVLIETADTDCDGRISLDDFRAMCARRILLRPRSLRLSFANPVRKAAHGSA